MGQNDCRFRKLIVGLLYLTASWAHGQSLEGKIEESYEGLFPQSGSNLVVGLFQGSMSGRARLTQIEALIPPAMLGQRLCFSAATFDGVYSARGELRVPAQGPLRLPIKAENFSRFAERLEKQYAAGDLAVGLARSPDCGLMTDAVLIPVSYGPPYDLISIALSTKPASDLEVSLKPEGAAPYNASCRPVPTRKTAVFQQMCEFRVDLAKFGSKPSVIQILRKVGDGPRRRESVSVYIVPQ